MITVVFVFPHTRTGMSGLINFVHEVAILRIGRIIKAGIWCDAHGVARNFTPRHTEKRQKLYAAAENVIVLTGLLITITIRVARSADNHFT